MIKNTSYIGIHHWNGRIVYTIATLLVADNYLVNTSTLVAYQGKPAKNLLHKEYHESMFDHVLTVYNINQDKNNRLNP